MGSAAVLGVLVQAKGIAQTTRDLRRVDSSIAQTAQVAEGAAGDIGQAGEKGGRRFAAGISKGAEKAKDAAKVGGAAIAVALGGGVAAAISLDAANDKLAAQLGLTGKASRAAGRVAGALYRDAYGESMEQVNSAIGNVVRNIGGMRTASERELRGVTAAVLDVASAFDQDLNETTRAAGQLMRTGLAKDAKGALDLITVGLQKIPNASEDLLDTFNEYGTSFRDLGLSGRDALGLLAQGMAGGARNTDVIGDALKELSIRVKTLDTNAVPALGRLGLNAKEMSSAFSQGGPAARAALDSILTKLKGVRDPAERARLAVKLFGTQGEDMGQALNALDLSKAAGAIGQVDGAAARMGQSLNDNAKTKLEAFKRQALGVATDAIGAVLLPALALLATGIMAVGATIGDVVDWFARHQTTSLALGAALGVVTAAFVTLRVVALAQMIPMLVRAAAAFVLMNLAMLANPVVLIVVALAALAAALVVAWQNSETFRAIVTAVWNAIKTAVGAAVAFIVPLVTTAWNAIKVVTSVVWGAIKAVIGVVWAVIKAIVTAALGIIVPVITAAWTVIKAVTSTIWNVIKAVITTVWAGIKAVTTTVLNALKAVITTVWNAIKAVTTRVWIALKLVLTTIWNAIKSVTTTVLNALKSVITTVWNGIKSVTSTVWNAIKSVITTVWNGIKSVVSSVLGWIKEKMGLAWAGLKIVTQNAWNTIKKYIIDPVRSAAGWVIDKIKWLADKLAAGFRSIWGIATDFAGGLRDRIVSAFRGVVNKIGGFINKIIGIVNKIPGVNIGYKFTPLAQGGQFSAAGAVGAVPEQALARGGMVSRPTVLVGEEGRSHPEFVIPTNPAYRTRATALMGAAAQKMGMEGFARGGVLGNADTFASVAKKMGSGPKSTLALFMAGVVESGMRNLSYGDRDSRGILQIRDQTARGMGINNMSVAQSAAAFLGRGFWNKGSAMSLSRSGMSAGQVAQNTQGSAYPAAYDQQRGRALGYLKAARGDKKGLGDLLKGAMSAVGDVASALNPMDFISKLPGVGDLPGWIQGLGKHAISGVTKWIKDKVASIIPSGGGGGGGSTTGLTDRVKDAVSYARSNGWSGGINSGFRSKAKQQALYDAYRSGRGNLAAPPGNSNHERGLAVDVSQPDQFARAMGRMGDGRLYRKVPGEPWHFSTTGYARGGVLDGARKAMTSPFVGSYATGGIVPRDGIAKVHKGERVTPPGRSDGPMVHIENYNVTDARHDEERLARKVGFRMRALGSID